MAAERQPEPRRLPPGQRRAAPRRRAPRQRRERQCRRDCQRRRECPHPQERWTRRDRREWAGPAQAALLHRRLQRQRRPPRRAAGLEPESRWVRWRSATSELVPRQRYRRQAYCPLWAPWDRVRWYQPCPPFYLRQQALRRVGPPGALGSGVPGPLGPGTPESLEHRPRRDCSDNLSSVSDHENESHYFRCLTACGPCGRALRNPSTVGEEIPHETILD